jgi:hypothetical protein
MRLPEPASLAVAALVALAPRAVAASPQLHPTQPPMSQAERVAIGGDLGRYEAMYGTPEFRGIDDEGGRPWPRKHSIRTVATFIEIPGRGATGSGAGYMGRTVEYLTSRAGHMLCGEQRCVAVTPVTEVLDFFANWARSWLQHQVEVIGAIDTLPVSDPREEVETGFQVWSITLFEGGIPVRRGAKTSTLEGLVRSPEAAAGRAVTVTGTFRGANLFSDLPPETRRAAVDWVLQDGPFSIWVTGKAPRGAGWSLDPSSRADCRFRLEVRGTIETRQGYVYLRAQSVALLGRAREGDPAR